MTIKTTLMLFSASSVILTHFSCRKKQETFNKPNILFITTDYTRGFDLPVTGAPFLKAPALSKLCEEGAVFMNHVCNTSICMPSRATMATGHYAHSHSLWDNRSIPLRQEDLPLLTEDFQKAGYTTAGIGKMHFHPFNGDYNYDYRVTLEGKDRKYRDDDYEVYLREHGVSREYFYTYSDGSEIPRGQSFYDWPFKEELHADAFVGYKTLEAIQNNVVTNDKPWFMWVSFTGPHNAWNAPERFGSYYRNLKDLPTGEFVEGELDAKPMDYTRHRYGYGGDLMHIYDKASEERKEEIRRGVRAGHYGLLSFIDEWIGKIMDQLETKGLLENTMVIFTSDHGAALFDNNMLHKGAAFPAHSVVPFVVWYPDKVKPGKRDGFSAHVDLYATFMELAGLDQPAKNEGKSIVPLLTNPKAKGKDFVVIESTMVSSVMNHQWLAGFHHITKEVELYNLQDDPMCHYNLADDEAYNNVIDTMKQTLVSWRKEHSDEGETVKDDPLCWYEELGDTTYINGYFKGYTNSYRYLGRMKDEMPGVTGEAARNVLRNAGIDPEIARKW